MAPIPNLLPAIAEVFLLLAGCTILIVDLFLSDRQRYITYSLVQLTLLACALLLVFVAARARSR